MTKRSNKAALTRISDELTAPAPKPVAVAKRRRKAVDPNPPREGQRADFLKVTVTLPPAMWTELKTIGMARRAIGEQNTGVSELARVAIAEWIERQRES